MVPGVESAGPRSAPCTGLDLFQNTQRPIHTINHQVARLLEHQGIVEAGCRKGLAEKRSLPCIGC